MSASFGSGRPKDPVGVECYFSPACRLGLVAFRRTTVQPTDGVDCHREEPPPANLRSDHLEGVAVTAGAAAGHMQLDLTDVEAPLLPGLSALPLGYDRYGARRVVPVARAEGRLPVQ